MGQVDLAPNMSFPEGLTISGSDTLPGDGELEAGWGIQRSQLSSTVCTAPLSSLALPTSQWPSSLGSLCPPLPTSPPARLSRRRDGQVMNLQLSGLGNAEGIKFKLRSSVLRDMDPESIPDVTRQRRRLLAACPPGYETRLIRVGAPLDDVCVCPRFVCASLTRVTPYLHPPCNPGPTTRT